MAWQLIVLRLDAEQLERAEALLSLAGAQSLSICDAADHALLEPGPGETPVWPSLVLRALFPPDRGLGAFARTLQAALGPQCSPGLETLADEDWMTAWRQNAEPQEFGAGFWVVPADAAPDSTRAKPLRLGMGLAFGTGRHATTALCLEWLATHELDRAAVLDFGCGSGILALAALKLGARQAWAVDNDPQALLAAGENARLNALEDAIWIGGPEALPPVQADVILANIVAGTLKTHAAWLASSARPAAAIVLSGILEHQHADVESAYAPYFDEFQCTARDGWVRLVGRRKDGAERPD